MDKAEFMRQWAVDWMPTDRVRLAEAAWDKATKTEREACAIAARDFLTKGRSPHGDAVYHAIINREAT